MKYITRYDFFNALGGLTITEIREELLSHSQTNSNKYTEIISDFERYIDTQIGIGPDLSTTKTKEDIKAQELTPFAPDEILHYENINLEPPYKLVFDFITIEPNNSVKLSQLKVSYIWDKGYVSRTDYEKERERIAVFVHRAFKFREACKMAIVELLEQPQPEATNSNELLKNLNDKIFNSDIGFTLFTKMFNLYKNELNNLANFSFLFYAMEKEFLVCGQSEFREFLRDEKYNIEIEKIDSRQSGENKKSKLYNSIKETLQKKHGLSTI
jgi:hypothetical protein